MLGRRRRRRGVLGRRRRRGGEEERNQGKMHLHVEIKLNITSLPASLPLLLSFFPPSLSLLFSLPASLLLSPSSPLLLTVEMKTTKGDQMLHVLKELQTSASSKLRYIALQSLFTLTREYPEKCNWEEHFKTTLLKLVETISDSDPGVRTVSLRVLREILKTQHDRLRDYAELTTMKVLKAFADTDASVSKGAPFPCRGEGWEERGREGGEERGEGGEERGEGGEERGEGGGEERKASNLCTTGNQDRRRPGNCAILFQCTV